MQSDQTVRAAKISAELIRSFTIKLLIRSLTMPKTIESRNLPCKRSLNKIDDKVFTVKNSANKILIL